MPVVITSMANFLLFFLVLTLFTLLARSCPLEIHLSDAVDVVDHGAVGDGRTDDTQAFKDAWSATCQSSAPSPTMHIPSGKTFLLQPLIFYGSCKSKNINIVIDGNLIAPSDPYAWQCNGNKCRQWIAFHQQDGLYISGSGTINGQGTNWWGLSCKHKSRVCGRKPTGLVIAHSNNVHISHLTFEDNPKMHIAFERSTWVYATNLTIKAPGHSPNTDGIHIQQSTNVFIDQSRIGTGDDCISIGDGSSYINISKISCGPGHGISIGSLGKKGEHETVEYVHVSNVEFRETSNGVRIKTWQGGRGYARNIVFEQIMSYGSNNPIIIDQFYCDHQHCKNQTSAVRISNVTYSQIHGTSDADTAVKFLCSKSIPCTDIFVNDINIQSTKDGSKTSSYCLNVEGRKNGEVIPNVPCLIQR